MNPNRHPRVHFTPAWTALALVLLSLAARLCAQTVDTFNPSANGTVYAMGVQADDKIIVGGSFTTLGGQSRANLARLNNDGTLDTTFNPGASNSVYCLAVQLDGKILVGGTFTNLAGQPRNSLGRLNADGTLDSTFITGASNSVLCLAIQPDGKILAGGTFTNLAGLPCNYLGRLNVDGSLDTSFSLASPVFGSAINTLSLQPDGKIVIGGAFSWVSGKARSNLARLNPDGSLDTTFTLAAGGAVYSLGLQPDGKILVGGYFSTLGGQTRNNLGRLNPDGSLDLNFAPSASSSVYSLTLQADGRILVGGNFSTLGGQTRNYLGRLAPDGTLDPTFNLSAGGAVNSVLLQADGKILAGGYFNTLGGQTRNRIGRLNNTEPATQELAFDGTTIRWFRSGTSPEFWRTSFELSTNGTDWMNLGAGQPTATGWQCAGLDYPTNACIRARGFVAAGYYSGSSWFLESLVGSLFITSAPTNQLVALGQAARFSVTAGGMSPLSYQWRKDGTNLPGATTSSLSFSYVQSAQLGNYDVIVSNPSGSVTSPVAKLSLYTDIWNPGANGAVRSIVPQMDGKILVAGPFGILGGQPRGFLGRFSADGTLDATFLPGPSGHMNCLAVQTDDKIVLGGSFETLGGQSQRGIGRLNSDGTLDSGFTLLNPGDKCTVNSLALQADGAILVGGSFLTLGNQPCINFGRLHPDGTLDTRFSPGPNGEVKSLALQPDGKILVGGSFTTLCGQARANLGRLNADGSLDTSFNPGANSTVDALVVQPDGKILVGGNFGTLCGQSRMNLGRLNANGSLDLSFNPVVNGEVFSLSLQTDGKILVGGAFTKLGGQTCNHIGRLYAHGAPDPAFNPNANGDVYCLALQPDGRVLAGGSFTSLSGVGRTNLGRLNNTEPAIQNLTYDGSTLSWLRGGTSPEIWRATFEVWTNGAEWAPLGNGQRINGGWQLTGVNLPANASIRARGFVATEDSCGLVAAVIGQPVFSSPQPLSRTNNAGTVATFTVQAWGPAAFSYQWRKDGSDLADGGNVVGANYSTLLLTNVCGNDAGEYLVVISAPFGSVTSQVATLRVTDPFISLHPVSQATNAGQTVVFQVTAGGSPPVSYQWCKDGADLNDTENVFGVHTPTLTLTNVSARDSGSYSFIASNAYGSVTSSIALLGVADPFIALQPTNQAAELGQTATFTVTAGGTAPFEYQWRKNGTPVPQATAASWALSNVQGIDSGSYDVLVSNDFGIVTSAVAVLTVNLATLDPLDLGTNDAVYNAVYSAVPQPDGKILVGGAFTNLAGQTCNYFGRLKPDGALDSAFNPEANGSVGCVGLQPDGKILVGGLFYQLGGQARLGLGRFNADDSLDATFNPSVNDNVGPLIVQADGKILLGGSFTALGGQARTNLGRLNPDGSLDTAFAPSAIPSVSSVMGLAMQADGKILVGGTFTNLAGQPRNCLGRLNSDGSLDTAFNPGATSNVFCLAVQADGKILVGGAFTNLAGQPRNCLGRLNSDGSLDTAFNPGADRTVRCLAVQADGKILVAGDFSGLGGQARNHLGRLNPDGSVDTTFYPDANSSVYSLSVQADGKILVGGKFTTLGSQARYCLGRLNNTEPAVQSLAFTDSIITWLRSGTTPEVWRTTFEASTNGTDWTSLGDGTRIPSGWQLTNISLPANATLRARGFVTGGKANGSSWFVESTLQLTPHTPPVILVNDDAFGFRSNQFGFNLTASPGQAVIVEGSTNLLDWTPLTTNLLSTNSIYFTDPQPFPQRFYRARQQ